MQTIDKSIYQGIDNIFSFTGDFEFLDNFYLAEVGFEGLLFPSVENAYQAAKCEEVLLRRIFTNLTPGMAKVLGREVKIRSDWDKEKVSIMKNLLEQKFCKPFLCEKLIKTEDALLVEGNTWGDTFWGVDSKTGQGENNLGKILMEIRTKISAVHATPYTELEI